MRIGIDLGGTSVKAALCEEDGTLLSKRSTPTRTGDAEGLCADMKLLALALCGERGRLTASRASASACRAHSIKRPAHSNSAPIWA